MYRYTDKYQTTPLKTFCMVFAIVFALVLSSAVFGVAERETGMGFFSLFPYAIAAGILIVLYQRVLREFHFTLTQEGLTVERSTGKRAKPVVTVAFEQMRAIEASNGERTTYSCALSRERRCVLTFLDEKQTVQTLLFSPDVKLRRLLDEKISEQNQSTQEQTKNGQKD